MRTERRTEEAKVRHAEDLLRQARADLYVYDADDASSPMFDDQRIRARLALAEAAAASRYVGTTGPGLGELAALVDAVRPLLEPASTAAVA